MTETTENTTKKCPSCKSDIPADAIKCSQCGTDFRGWAERNKVLLIIVSVIVVLMLIGKTPSHNTNDPTEVAVKITASELLANYQENEINADNNFKGKVLEVTGRIGNIGKDITDAPYVTLVTNDPILQIQCLLADKSAGSNLRPSTQITVRGIGGGKFGNVILNECVPVETETNQASSSNPEPALKNTEPDEEMAAPAEEPFQAP